MKKRYLILALLGGLLLGPVQAEQDRDAKLRKYIGDSSEAARQARLGKVYSSACSCTQGTLLSGTASMVFNCSCGTMQCVVAANRSGGGAPNLVCR
ncbi:MAG: hypothetical protein D6720_08385 [Gammaproteobacteria bacterium]|nr:MAG: hypothetical protein D6720_08385 [Gammaproteobacteria bacterium]